MEAFINVDPIKNLSDFLAIFGAEKRTFLAF